MATDNFWDKFSRWRRHRPFWGGLFLLLAAIELLYTANMNLGNLQIHLGPQGFLSYLLPVMLIIAGLLSWFTPAQRLFYGIIGLLTALYSFIGLNLGGFFGGMLLGIVGAALVIAWGPPRVSPGQEAGDLPPDGEPYGNAADHPAEPRYSPQYPREDVEVTRRIDIAGHDDRPRGEHLRPASQSAIVPGFDQEYPKSRVAKLGKNPKTLTVGLIVVGVSATVLVAGSRAPASADECPAGLPSRSASATAATATASTSTSARAAAKKATTKAAAAASTAAKSASATPSASASTDSGNTIIDGINSIIDGVGNLLGLGDTQSASPSTSPSPSESASADPSASATTEPTKTTDPSATTEPTKTSSSATATASASDDSIPCLGARVLGLEAGNDGLVPVAAKAGLLETDSLTMYDSTYDGVVELPTKSGTTIRSLKFSMTKAVNKPFSLTIDEPNGHQTVITSDELTVSSNVKFYTSRFEGKLFGLIPVVFTPDSPPPLTLPVLWFTDVKIQLNLVRCDTLTGKPLKINETN